MSNNNKTVKASDENTRVITNKKNSLWICLVIAILIVIGALALSLYIINKSYTDIEQRVIANQQYAHQAVTRLHGQHQQNYEAITRLQNNQINQQTEVVLYAKYLIRLAQIQLNDLHNLTTGLRLYQKADQVLAKITSAKVQLLQQAVKTDIKQLSKVKPINQKVLYENLENVINQVMALKITEKWKTPVTAQSGKNAINQQPVTVTHWRQIKNTVSDFLQKIFIIERVNQSEQALLTPTEYLLIKQNIIMKLQQAQLALLQNQPTIYQAALNKVLNWLDKYEQPQAKEVIKQLKQLAKQPITTKMPALKTKDINWS